MNFFENELRRMFADGQILTNPVFVGRACFGDIGKDLRGRVEFVTTEIADHYSALQATIMNRQEGVVDRMTLRLEDLLGTKPVPGNPNFRNGVKPHIWTYNGKAEWYAYTPTQEDYQKMRQGVGRYIDVFRPLEERTQTSSLKDMIQQASSRATEARRSEDTHSHSIESEH